MLAGTAIIITTIVIPVLVLGIIFCALTGIGSTQVHSTTPTKYRLVGSWPQFLEYEHGSKFFGITVSSHSWSRVPRPYANTLGERGLPLSPEDEDGFVTYKCADGSQDARKFIDKWPNISAYLEYYEVEQKKVVAQKREEYAKWQQDKRAVQELS